MTTAFALLSRACGLSQREAAAFLNVRLDTVTSWSTGRNRCPDRVIGELQQLFARIDMAAFGAVALQDELEEDETITARVAETDEAAQAAGWPCVGAMAAVAGLIVARSIRKVVLTG